MCLFVSKSYDKVYHINNSNTNQKICDIHLITTHRMTAGSTMSVKVDNSVATMEGQKSTGCCGPEIHTIKNNMAITIKYPSIPLLFEQHNVQFVLNMAPLWDKPYSRLHLYIDGKHVSNTSHAVNEYTETSYTADKICIWWTLLIVMSVIFTFLYAFLLGLFIGAYTWVAIEVHVVFGALTWISIWSGFSKALCGCTDPSPSEVDISFDPNACIVKKTDRVLTVVTEKQVDLVVNELPIGWVTLQTARGKTYYYNNMTQQTLWERPNTAQKIDEELKKAEMLNEAIQIMQIKEENNHAE